MKSLVCIFILAFSSLASAKELSNRLGVGFRNAYAWDLPAIAAVYYPSSDFGVVGAIGIDTEKDNAKSAFTIGLRRILFKEENMNFFMGGLVSLLSREVSTVSHSGYEINAHVGGEFFMPGLDSLGFNFETGISMSTVEKTRFRTTGDHFLRAGIVFYF